MADAQVSPSDVLPPGTVMGDRFEIQDVVGEGAMGVVYRAGDKATGGVAAVKVLRKHLTDSREYRGRFKREARAASRFRHDSAVRVLASGIAEGNIPYIAMELVEGKSLKEIIATEAPMVSGRACNIVQQILRALSAAHRQGIVHRDMKPDNIRVLVDDDGIERPKILDFGVAKFITGDVGEVSGGLKTKTGVILGTPKYMSPEQIRGETIDGRADVYAVGAMLHEMVTGVPPFEADDVFGFVTKHLKEKVLPITESFPDFDVPQEVDSFVLRMLEKDPRDRPSDGSVLADEIEPWAVEDPKAAEKGRVLRTGVRAVCVAGAVSAVATGFLGPGLLFAPVAAAVGLAAGASLAATKLPRPSVYGYVKRVALVLVAVLVLAGLACVVGGAHPFVALAHALAAALSYVAYLLVWNSRKKWLRLAVAGLAAPLLAVVLMPMLAVPGAGFEGLDPYFFSFLSFDLGLSEAAKEFQQGARTENLLCVLVVAVAFGAASMALPRPRAARL